MDKKEIMEVLNHVYDPDYVNRSVVDMGLVTEDDITVTAEGINIAYSLTAPLCPFSAAIGLMIKHALEKKQELPVTVGLKAGHHQTGAVAELLADPKRSQELMNMLEETGTLKRCLRL